MGGDACHLPSFITHIFMKHFITILFLIPIILSNTIYGQETWHFNGSNPLLDHNGKSLMTLHTVKQIPEFVKGINGNALRTDGYSTWMDITTKKEVSTVAGWFALESYPTDTAAFIGVADSAERSIAVCVNQFGTLLLGIGTNGSYTYHSLNTIITRFSWLHLLVDVKGKSIYLNDKKIYAGDFGQISPQQKTMILIGKDFRNKKNGMYDVTAINGLISDINIGQTTVDISELHDDVAKHIKETPVLAIPETRFANDFNRPHYHLLPSANWTNETHGLIYYAGKYHIFNQKNASGIFLGQINWGHYSSSDLIHWTEERPALSPDAKDGRKGIWSGCAVINDDGIPQIIYTAGDDSTSIATAFPKDSTLIEWNKYIHNPIIAVHPASYTRTDMRDPFVWKEGNNWYMIIGYGIGNKDNLHGALLLYKSENLKTWNYLHLLYEGNPVIDNTGIFWEMPVFKKIRNKYVLLVNRVPNNGIPACCQYWIGNFKEEKFIPDNPIPQNLEIINRLLSPSVLETPNGDIVSIAIIPDEIGGMPTYRQGWAHLYSIPRKWTIMNGKLCQTPLPTLKELRGDHKNFHRHIINTDTSYTISENKHQIEIDATFYPNDATRFGFILCKNPDNSEFSRIYYDKTKQEMVVDQTHSSLRERIPLTIRKDHYSLDCTNPVNLHLFIDGSVIEGFINDQDAFTTRIFPLKENSTRVELFSNGSTTEATADVWTIEDAKVKMNF